MDIGTQNKQKSKKTAAQIAVLLVIFNLGCKLLGFIREMIMAQFYGAGYEVDSLVMAQSIPNIIFGGILVAIATAYMPLYSKRVESQGEKEGNYYTSQMITVLVGLSLVISIIGVIFADQIVSIMSSGFGKEAKQLTSYYLRMTFGYTAFSAIVGIFANYLQYKNHFIETVLGDYIQNIVYIVMIVVSARTNEKWLALGLLFGYAFRCIFLFSMCRKQGYKYLFSLSGTKKVLNEILNLSIPVFLGTTIQEINTFVDRTLASRFPNGSISALNYANQINTIVISLSITILTTIIYPKLVQVNVNVSRDKFIDYLQKGFTVVLLIAVPVSFGGIIYSHGIVQFIYEHGAFDSTATEITAMAYVFYSLGVVFLAINDYFTKVYYSMGEMKIPMLCAGVSLIVNVILNLILVQYMEQNGLALATSIAAMIHAILMISYFSNRNKELPIINGMKKIILILAASIVSVGSSYLSYIILCRLYPKAEIPFMLAGIIEASILYCILLKIFQINEFDYLIRSLLHRK